MIVVALVLSTVALFASMFTVVACVLREPPPITLAVTDDLSDRIDALERLTGDDSPFAMKRRKNKSIGDRPAGDE